MICLIVLFVVAIIVVVVVIFIRRRKKPELKVVNPAAPKQQPSSHYVQNPGQFYNQT